MADLPQDTALAETQPLTRALAQAIIKDICEGVSLKAAAATHRVSWPNFYYYMLKYPDLTDAYAAAQTARAELHADEILEIADNEIDLMRAKLKIDTRKWYASKMQPRKYGDRLDVNISQQPDILGAIEAARGRVLPIRDQLHTIDAEYADMSSSLEALTTDKASVANEKDAKNIEDHDLFK